MGTLLLFLLFENYGYCVIISNKNAQLRAI